MKTHRVPDTKCLECGAEIGAATGGQSGPKPGSLSLCAECGAITAFDEHLKLRPLTPEERAEFAGDKDLMRQIRGATRLAHFFRAAAAADKAANN